jgi:hypothetical protein
MEADSLFQNILKIHPRPLSQSWCDDLFKVDTTENRNKSPADSCVTKIDLSQQPLGFRRANFT